MATSNKELSEKLATPPPPTANGKGSTIADQIGKYLATPAMRNQIASALPKHLTAERLSRVALTTIRTTPALLQCTVESLLAAIMQSAQLGLEPGILGHAYFVPFNKNIGTKAAPRWIKEVQFIIGYKGFLDLVRRTGKVTTVGANPIYSKDKFRVQHGYSATLEHEPNFAERGELIGFYAYALTSDGGKYCEVMTLDEVQKVRQRSKAKDDGPWVADFVEMGRKTVIRRLCKYLPLSIEIAEHIDTDEAKEFGDAQAIELNLGETKTEGAPVPELDAPKQGEAFVDEETGEVVPAAATSDVSAMAAFTRN